MDSFECAKATRCIAFTTLEFFQWESRFYDIIHHVQDQYYNDNAMLSFVEGQRFDFCNRFKSPRNISININHFIYWLFAINDF